MASLRFVSFFAGIGGIDLVRHVVIAYIKMADTVACLGDIHLMPVAGADELAILHGIASALLSRAEGPAEGDGLPCDAADDPLPDIPPGIQPVGAYLGIAQSGPPGPVGQVFEALAGVGCFLHSLPPVRLCDRHGEYSTRAQMAQGFCCSGFSST